MNTHTFLTCHGGTCPKIDDGVKIAKMCGKRRGQSRHCFVLFQTIWAKPPISSKMEVWRISSQWYFLDNLLLKYFQHIHIEDVTVNVISLWIQLFVNTGSLTVCLDCTGNGSFVEADFAICSEDCHSQRKEGILSQNSKHWGFRLFFCWILSQIRKHLLSLSQVVSLPQHFVHSPLCPSAI